MKKKLHNSLFIGLLTLCSVITVKSQTVSTFEALTLPVDSFWNGTSSAGFKDGNAYFTNYYNAYWLGGFAYSNKKDSTTPGFKNMYAARAGSGYANSGKYAVGQQNAAIYLKGAATGKVVNGVYVNNTTYAALSMKNGDDFAKKFGGTSGNDPDWFKLTVTKYYQGTLAPGTVDFYLADFRFADNSKDYIVTDWRWIDLTSLGNVDSLKLTLTSSDVGNFGINTPTYFCLDNFTTADIPLNIAKTKNDNLYLSLYPNPASDILTVKLNILATESMHVEITDITGRTVYNEKVNGNTAAIRISQLITGIYNLKITTADFAGYKSFIKQ